MMSLPAALPPGMMWVFGSVIVLILALTWLVAISRGDDHPTPDECWKAGIFYSNPDDPALFVRKRSGIGYTLNFGNSWAWPVLALILLLSAAPFFLLRFSLHVFSLHVPPHH
jgi:uncharacterized membrane protein